jgi:hypothetical protein
MSLIANDWGMMRWKGRITEISKNERDVSVFINQYRSIRIILLTFYMPGIFSAGQDEI